MSTGIVHRAAALDYLDRHSMTEPNSGCTLWTGPVRSEQPGRNYGQMYVSKARPRMPAHRFAYEVFVGPIPPGMHVLHTCDTPPCVNPQHLRLGSHQENMAEKARKGRGAGTRPIERPGAPESLVPLRTQITKAQYDWLVGAQQRSEDRSLALSVRRAIQAAMDAEQQRKVAS